ncbi:MAG: sensor histidine kinase [Tsuneonella sp.]
MTAPPPIDFARLFERSPNPYVVLDGSLAIVWANDAYLAVTMRERGDIVGRPLFEAFPSDPESESHKLLEGSLRRVLRTGKPDELALIRYDIANPEGGMDSRYWSATHTPLPGADGRTAYVLQHTVDVTELHGLRRLRDDAGLVQRADAIQARNRDLAEERDRFRAMFEQAPGFVGVVSGPRHVFLMANAAYRRLVGERPIIGKSLAEAVPEVVEQGYVALLDRVRDNRRTYVGDREELFLRAEGSDELERRVLTFIYQPVLDDDEVVAIFIQGHDVTQEVDAADAQKLLINELNHRVKNTLAIVQGLAAQSFRKLAGADDALGAFDARLNALAAAHSLLTAGNWEAAPLEDTVRSAVAATLGPDDTRVALAGPDLALPPQAAVSLAMLVHELSTNAIKYGALSCAEGRVAVDWAVDDEPDRRKLTVRWRESGGPPVAPPSRRGFGTRLIERGISAEGGNKAVLDFRPEGLACTIVTRIGDEG